ENEHCDQGHCGRQYGSGYEYTCTDGAVGARCDSEDDGECAEARCATDAAGAGWTCSGGQVGDRCSTPRHCVAGECALGSDLGGVCTDGAVGSSCTGDAQGASVRCAIRPGREIGTCVDGTEHALCYGDD